MKIQEIVLNELWLSGKKETYSTIVANTGLTYNQVLQARRDLENRRLIKRYRKNKRTYIEFNDAVIPRIKTILKRAKEDDH